MSRTQNLRIAFVALSVLAFDQLTKFLVRQFLTVGEERTIIDGFFKLVHWQNTGAAWSILSGRNGWLAIIALIALVVLFRSRHHFDAHTPLGQTALGLIFGGILGNLVDRLFLTHVTDFLYFYLKRRGGEAVGFPAFNIADSAICIGVFLIFISSWKSEKRPSAPLQSQA